jgi:uncharacterized protein YjbI with pentapeptide repeats
MATTITSITNLQNLTNLQEFNADWTSLQTVNLSGLTQLTTVDVSDTIKLDDSGHSLTNVNLSGCTALEQLRLDDSDFSAGIPDLSGLTSLQFFDMDQCSISGAVDISASSFNNLTGFDLSGNSITSITLPEANLDNVNLNGNALTETAVNNVLQWLDGSGVENGYVNLEGGTNAIPTEGGATSKTNLQNKGWSVYVNQGEPGYVGIAASTDFDIVGNFTIEMFVNVTNFDGFPRPYSFGAYPAPNAISIEGSGSSLYFWANEAALLASGVTFTPGQWTHICVMGVGSTAYMFVNGVVVNTAAYSGSISSQGLPLTIGYGNEPSSGFNGLMTNFRWTTTQVYDTSGFTVPTSQLTNLVGTKLLIFQGNNIGAQLTDNSGNNHDATNSGATYSALNPFSGVQGSLQMGNV